METLVLAEHDGKTLRRDALCALTVARDLASRSGSKPVILLLGRELAAVRDDARRFGDVVVADHSLLARPTAERYAAVIADIIRAQGVRELVAAASTFSRDILPRVAAVVDAAMGGMLPLVLRRRRSGSSCSGRSMPEPPWPVSSCTGRRRSSPFGPRPSRRPSLCRNPKPHAVWTGR